MGFHLRKVGNYSLVMPNSILVMLMAEIFQAATGKLGTLVAAINRVLLCTGAKTIAADSAMWGKLVRQTAVAI
ncbi:MAG: hypothetical protein RR276_09430, partial [Angelakisella sp.]